MKTIILSVGIIICCIHAFAQDTINIIDKNGLKQGKWIEYFPNEEELKYAIINYKDDMRQGEFNAYRKDSTLYMKGYFLNGKLHGDHFTYYETGELKIKTYYLYDKENGMRVVYNEDGTKYSETEYTDNEKNGSYILYYSNGSIKRKGEYSMGKKIGIWKDFSTKGEIINSTNY